MAGTLYVVATPLGNLEDLSPRAAATLTRAAAVAAEDTRHTKPLLAHVGSRAELISFHAHSSDAALHFGAHPLQRLRDRDDLSPRGVQGRGVHGLAFAEEQQQALLRQVGRDVAIDATVTVALAEGEEVVEVNEREPGAMNQPAHLRERQLREAHRRIHQASGARAHGPPGRMLRQMLLNLLLQDRLRVRAHQRIHVSPVLEE